jgi:hypothetical protein
MTYQTWIALVAALGVGSVIAAVVGWWSAKAVTISNHRQNWINVLRDDLVTYLKEVDVLHFMMAKILGPGGTTDDLEKQQEARNAAMLVYRRILMRLNMTEPRSIQLADRLRDLMTITSGAADEARVDAVVNASRELLKQEWAVTKYGIFTRPALVLKRFWATCFGD